MRLVTGVLQSVGILLVASALGCGSNFGGRPEDPRRDYPRSPQQTRAAVIDTMQSLGLEVESSTATVVNSRWMDAVVAGGGVQASRHHRLHLRVEIRGSGEHSTVLAKASHSVASRKGARTEWEAEPTRGRLEDLFLDRLDTRLGRLR